MARPVPRGGLRAIEHVIVLMQENRSFNHYFGRLQGVRGYGDRTPLRLRNGSSVFHQPVAAGGEVLPFSLREAASAAGRPVPDIQYLGALPHGFVDATSAWADGWNDNWIAAKGAATMTYYERRDIPLQYELADTFTICDAYHCSVNGSTNPNRNYLWTGTTGFEPDTGLRAVTNAAYSYDHPGYDWVTYPERLEAAGVSWRIYQEWDNFTDNAVEYFEPFKRIGTKMLTAVTPRFRTTEELYDRVMFGGLPPAEQQRLLAELAAGRELLTDAEKRLFDLAMYRSEPETLVPRLRADIAAGTLPQVSWLVPSSVDSEHPGASTPVGSANLIFDVLDAIASDPDTWAKTVLFVNFDENDGYFDHVPPPVAPRPESGEGDDWFAGQPIGLGPRVPMTVVSPWTIGGHVCSEVFDHTSVLRFLERWTGVEEPNISRWRRSACGDLLGVFDFRHSSSPPRLDHPDPVPPPIDRWHPSPPAVQSLPGQEPGRRRSRALPYTPFVSARLDEGSVRLTLANTGTRPAHFAVYRYDRPTAAPVHLDVERSTTESMPLDPGGYDLVVQGPNRFWFEAAGDTAGAAASVEVGSRAVRSASRVHLDLANRGTRTVRLTIRGLAYTDRTQTVTLHARHHRTLSWPTDDGWYDIEVRSPDDPAFRRRITGRLESTKPSFTA